MRLKIALAIVAALLLSAALEAWMSHRELSRAYAGAGQAEAVAIARTFAGGTTLRRLRNPVTAERELERLRQLNPGVLRASIFGFQGGRPMRVATTGTEMGIRPARRADVAPVRTGRRHYAELDEDDRRVGELSYPLRGADGDPGLALGLYFDIEPLESALTASLARMAAITAVTAAVIIALLSLLLGRLVFTPLRQLRRATQRLAAGYLDTRLHWSRSDELGELATSFDAMAGRLQDGHRRLRRQTLEDGLTRLLNHRGFHAALADELARARRTGGSVALVAVDIDHFKELNDRFGHAEGDNALRMAADAMTAELRTGDLRGRVGGDEFMLAIPGADADAALAVVERIRRTVVSEAARGARFAMTLSAGIAVFPAHTTELEELIRLADGALYGAKRAGRNRSRVHAPGAPAPRTARQEVVVAQRKALLGTVRALAAAVDAKDGYTHQHSRRVAIYAAALAKSIGMPRDRIERITQAGVLHDVGKIAIPEAVLLKPAELTPTEFAEMRRHSAIGHDIIANAGLTDAAEWVRHLHERVDGGGYPDGLRGDQIPFESRILAVADALEAMTSSRLYRPALALEPALAELERGAGTQFDPALARQMVALVRDGEVHAGSAAVEIDLAADGDLDADVAKLAKLATAGI